MRNIQTYINYRSSLFAYHKSVIDHSKPHFLRKLLFMEIVYVLISIFNSLSCFLIKVIVACLYLFRCYFHFISSKLYTVKLCSIFQYCLVTTCLDIVRNFFGNFHLFCNIKFCTFHYEIILLFCHF